MKLFAISDLHLNHEENRQALLTVDDHPDDWLILCGDIGETPENLKFALDVLTLRFKKLIWVPGNHELWSVPSTQTTLKGELKYKDLVRLCGSYGVITPEDPYPVARFGNYEVRLAPLFLLYDYSFRPSEIPLEQALEWAKETDVVCADEVLLDTDPYPNVIAWCHARCLLTEKRLLASNNHLPTVLINHFPLLQQVVRLPRIPRFSIWCGTQITNDWHTRFNAIVVVSGHLHMRSTMYCDQVRFEEVSLGYPRQWKGYTTLNSCIREILA